MIPHETKITVGDRVSVHSNLLGPGATPTPGESGIVTAALETKVGLRYQIQLDNGKTLKLVNPINISLKG